MSEADRDRYMDDAIHFTPDGYDLIGQKIGTTLLGSMAKDKARQANGSSGKAPEERRQSASATTAPPREAERASGETSAAEETKRKAIALAMNTQLTPPKRRRLKGFRDDDKKFEEEEGSPDELEKGYIVVRKQDLFDV
jgi:hypothetical protein